MQNDKGIATIPDDFLALLAREKARLTQLSTEVGKLSKEEHDELLAAAVEVLDEKIPGAGQALRTLTNRQISINTKKNELAAQAIGVAMRTPDNEIDGAFIDLHSELAMVKDEQNDLNADAQRLKAHLATLFADSRHQDELQAAAQYAQHQRELVTQVAAEILSKTQFQPASIQPPSATLRTSDALLSGVINAYCESQLAEKAWTSKTEAECRSIYTLWLRIVKDQQISGYGYEQHREYKAILQKLPPNLNKHPLYIGRELDEIIAMGHEPMALNTIKKSLIRVAALFNWAVKHGYTTHNPASGMVIKSTRRPSEERQAFNSDDLKKLFDREDFTRGRYREPYMYWTPLLALYTGARLNEIAQLHLADFLTKNDVPVISINDNEESKRVKTRAGRRLIPIHPELIRLGLLKFVEHLRQQGKSRLFPELKPGRDGYGQLVSKWFSRYRKRCGIIDNGKVFHSFRHTFIDRLKQAGVAKEKIAALVGHEDDSETFGRYGKDFEPVALLEVIHMLQFDLSYLQPLPNH